MPRRKRLKRSWKVEVTYVPYESEAKRDWAYEEWVRIFLKGKKAEIEHLNRKTQGCETSRFADEEKMKFPNSAKRPSLKTNKRAP